MICGHKSNYKRRIMDMPSEFRPWLPERAIEFMDDILRAANDEMDPVHVMEHGAGTSTVWLAERCDYLLSFETSPKWYSTIGATLQDKGLLDHTDLIFASQIEEIGIKLPATAPRAFDLVFVDGRGRIKFWEKARKYIKPGGWVCWDDAERQKYWNDGLSTDWLYAVKDWVWEFDKSERVDITTFPDDIKDFWPVYAFNKPEKKGSYTLFARKPHEASASNG
jgi:predicted O-methyltransferase YrrM